MAMRTVSVATKVALIYFLFSIIWILVTDFLLLALLEDIDRFWLYSSGKGILFITVSAGLIYWLIRREIHLLHTAQQSITHLETHDPLTGLYNRSQFEQTLTSLETKRAQYGLILLDINGLRLINELYDYDTGNALLRDVAKRIVATVPARALIARSGGDTFAIILETNDFQQVKDLAETLQSSLGVLKLGDVQSTLALGYAFNDSQRLSRDVVAESESALKRSKLADQSSSSNAVINSIKTALYERSDETEQHAQRMQALAHQFGQRLNLSYYNAQ